MQFTITTDYAVRIVCYLASQIGTRSVAQISDALQISTSYTAKIVGQLKKGGIVQATEGTGGGYKMMQAPEDISLLDIMKLTEKTMFLSQCLQKENCCPHNAEKCPLRTVYQQLQEEMEKRLKNTKITAVLDINLEKRQDI